MIAWLGILMYQHGYRQELSDTLVRQHFRPEEVEIIWRKNSPPV
jgi:tRNA A37 threonylcarbamoyltransferase TsaD